MEPQDRPTREPMNQSSPFECSKLLAKRVWLIRNGAREDDVSNADESTLNTLGNSIKCEIESFRGRHYDFPGTPQSRFSISQCPQRHRESGSIAESIENERWFETLQSLIGASKTGRGFTVALLGNRGTGKSQIGVELIRRCCLVMPCLYAKASDIFREIRSTYIPKSSITEKDVFNRFAKVPLLVIDEVHQRGDTTAENNALIQIIDARYDAKRDTMLIANQTKEEFAAAIGSSVVSRIHETGEAIVCDWPSFRKPGTWKRGA
jgi:hypothetical protein